MGIGALCNLEHRGATGRRGRHRRRRRHPDPGPGPVPARRRRSSSCPRPAPTRSAWRSCPRPERRREGAGVDRRDRRRRGPHRPRLARRAGRTRTASARRARSVMPTFRQLFIADPAGATGIDLDRKVFVVRKRIEHELPDEQRTYFPSLSSPHAHLQGHVHDAAARARSSPTCSDERVESALALVHSRFSHEHVPVLAARPPVPVHRPQRRDQHGAGQPQLDAHPRGDARRATCCPASSGRSRSARPAPATRRRSTRCSSCCTSAAAACRTRC